MLVRLSTPRTYFFAFAFVRAFSRTSASATRSTKVAKEKPKKTKKLLSELSDAVSVKKRAPLPEWDGGLSKPAPKRRPSNKDKASPKSDSKAQVKRTRTRSKTSNKVVEEAPQKKITRSRPTSDLAREIFANIKRFPQCLLLTRVGQFYESYFDQAPEIAKLLNIKHTSKAWGGQRVDMCGFPLAHLERHLKVLVQTLHRRVALCEEFKRPDGTFERRVTRIVTPGTLIDEAFLNPYENNYMLAISNPVKEDAPVGLAWMDVSTGEFFSQSCALSALRDELARIAPKEIVLNISLEDQPSHPIRLAISEETTAFTSFISSPTCATAAPSRDEPPSTDGLTTAPTSNFTSTETSAISLLTSYLESNLLEHMPVLSKPLRLGKESRMQLDSHTTKSLEIRESMREGGVTGSLLSVINRTVTSSGTRLLARWLSAPSVLLPEINARQDVVGFFHARPHLRADIIVILRKIEDTARIVQKFLSGRGAPDDLADLRDAIDIWEELRKRMVLEHDMEYMEHGALRPDWGNVQALLNKMKPMNALCERITMAVDRQVIEEATDESPEEEDPFVASAAPLSREQLFPTNLYRWSIKPGFSPQLSTLHTHLGRLESEKSRMESEYQAEFSAPSLALKASPGYGIHVHVRKRDASKLSQDARFVPLTTNATTVTFFHQPWFNLATKMSETANAIYQAEHEAFKSLRDEINQQSNWLRSNARVIDELDVTVGFAELAYGMKLTRPTMTNGCEFSVVNGRHPTVELGLLTNGRLFVPNDVFMDESSVLHVITGPNMAGKSTLLRQTALITILAQIGSFVPADAATIGIVDKLFSRVGSSDDLFRDRSTFMVEMLETSEILKQATPKSLVIMDEVGRGTTVSDGLSIAFATIYHLHMKNRCRALFATHFHELADMLGLDEVTGKASGVFESVSFFCTDVDEIPGGGFSYSHRLRGGVNRDSHGLKVAKLSGMPAAAIQMATSALEELRRHEHGKLGRSGRLRKLGELLTVPN